MIAIAAVDNNWAIGNEGKLLFHIKEDMQRFRNTTMGNICVMGRKTLESFPGGRPLEGRVNMVFTRDKNYSKKGVITVSGIEEMNEKIAELMNEDPNREVFLIGGDSIYHQLIDECLAAYITKVDYVYQADAYFPDLEKKEGWELIDESEEYTSFDLAYTFNVYRNTGVKK
ncbi:MAG: dihydrofolate reductase [Lachnospiraceae bacterium]|nr:dihydrofolate reductase [Lachnospiraceae bacterium]